MSLQLTEPGCPRTANTMRMANISKAVRLAVGLFLLAAAGLKAHGIATDPASQDSLLLSPRLLIATIEVEIVLGLWLLSEWAIRGAWLVCIGFFTILAAVSLKLALEGQPSCGCFGRITVSPWWTFALDVALIGVLVACRPRPSEELHSTSGVRTALTTGAGAVACLGLIGGAFWFAFDDPAAALARLRGEPITVEPSLTDVGDGISEEVRTLTIQLVNRGEQPVAIVGGTANCSCLATASLPGTVPPGESRPVTVQVTFKGQRGRFQHKFFFYTNDSIQPVVIAWFGGRVVQPPS